MHTNLVTNGTLLESKIDEIAQYINGAVYVSLDGLEKTHDMIRGVTGCFRKAVRGIMASRGKVSVAINTTVMAENIHEIEDVVRVAKELDTEISVAVAYEYCNAKASAPASHEIRELAGKLVEMKKKGYPLVIQSVILRSLQKRKTGCANLGHQLTLVQRAIWFCPVMFGMNMQPAFLFLKTA